MNKVIARILTDRLAFFLPLLIAEEDFAFISDRSIHECISLAHQMIVDLVFRGNAFFQIDMAKAYDHLEWPFLLAMRRRYFLNGSVI